MANSKNIIAHASVTAAVCRLRRFLNKRFLIVWLCSLSIASSTLFAQGITRDSVEKILKNKTLHPANTADRVKQLNKMAFTYVGYNADFILLFANQAMELAKKTGDKKGQADAMENQIYYYQAKVDYTKGLELALVCLDQYKLINDYSGMSQASQHLAQLYKFTSGAKITEEYIILGLDYSKKAYQYALVAKDTNAIIMSLNLAGIIYRDWAKKYGKSFYYDSAYNCYMRALSIITTTAGTDNLGKLYNNISQVYTEYKNNPAKALEYLLKAEAFNLERNRYTSLSHNYGNISNTYILLGNKQKAMEYAYKTRALAQRNNNPERLMNAYLQLSQAYEFNHQFDSALYSFKRSTELSDSVTNIEKTKQITDAQTKYETVKKQAEINMLGISNKVKTRNIYLLGLGLLLLGGFAIAMIVLYSRVQKQKIQLADQSNKLELMMKELHHRVKNNLQIVSSLLSLQSYRLHDVEAVAAMNESKQRVQAMSLIHQRLYKSDMLTSVNIKEYITDLTSSLMAAYGYQADDFELQLNIEKELMDVEKALPIGLILNEVITNAFKYAYKDIAAPSLHISLQEKDGQVQLAVKDNGVGINAANWNKKTGSFGKQLIGSLCKQLRAQQQVSGEGGTAFTFIIPVKAA
jgi:two-component sensor histidine kinase